MNLGSIAEGGGKGAQLGGTGAAIADAASTMAEMKVISSLSKATTMETSLQKFSVDMNAGFCQMINDVGTNIKEIAR